MNKAACCRICLTDNVKLHNLLNSPLQELYENITDAKVSQHDKPTSICYLCYATLNRCIRIQEAAKRSEELLTQLFLDDVSISDSKLSLYSFPPLHNYITTAVEQINIDDESEGDRYMWSGKGERDSQPCFEIESVKEENGLDDSDMLEDGVKNSQSQTLSDEARLPSQSIEVSLTSRLSSCQDQKQSKYRYLEIDGLKLTIAQDFGGKIDTNFDTQELTSDIEPMQTCTKKNQFKTKSLLSKRSKNGSLNFEYKSKKFNQNLDLDYETKMLNLDLSSSYIQNVNSSKTEPNEINKFRKNKKNSSSGKFNSEMSFESGKSNTEMSYESGKFDSQSRKMSYELKAFSKNQYLYNMENTSEVQYDIEPKKVDYEPRVPNLNLDLTYEQSSSRTLETESRVCFSPCETDSEDDLPLKLLRKNSVTKNKTEKFVGERKRQYRRESAINAAVELVGRADQVAELKARASSENYLHAAYRCHHCYRGFLTEEVYVHHMGKHDESRGAYACEVCALRYGSARQLAAHARAAHARRYRCLTCAHYSNTKNQARDHQRLHTGDLYECKMCSKAFHARTSYLTHVRAAHGAARAGCVCAVCGERFLSEQGRAMHRAKMHAHTGDGESSAPGRGFVCAVCGERCSSEQDLAVHIESKHHGVLEEDDSRANTKYCDSCDIHFASRRAWTRHVLNTPAHIQLAVHTKECPICLQSIEGTVRSHMRIHDRETKPRTTKPPANAKLLQCEQCPLTFASKSRVNAHTRRVHLGIKYDKNLVCETCGKHCTSRATLRYHQRTHSGERPYPCSAPACNKRFPDAHQLRLHTRTHTGERPYTCHACGRGFSQRAALTRHTRVHTGIKPHTCDICQKSFSQSNSLSTHVKSVHLKMPRKLYTKNTFVRKNNQNLVESKKLPISDTRQITPNVGSSDLSEVTLVDEQVHSKIELGQ